MVPAVDAHHLEPDTGLVGVGRHGAQEAQVDALRRAGAGLRASGPPRAPPSARPQHLCPGSTLAEPSGACGLVPRGGPQVPAASQPLVGNSGQKALRDIQPLRDPLWGFTWVLPDFTDSDWSGGPRWWGIVLLLHQGQGLRSGPRLPLPHTSCWERGGEGAGLALLPRGPLSVRAAGVSLVPLQAHAPPVVL